MKRVLLSAVLALCVCNQAWLPACADDDDTKFTIRNGPFVSRGNTVQFYTAAVNLKPDQLSQPLQMKFINGSSGPKFQWLRVFLNAGSSNTSVRQLSGRMLIDVNSFGARSQLIIPLTGQLAANNVVMIQGAGLPGARCAFEISTPDGAVGGAATAAAAGPKLHLTSVEPPTVSAGGTITIKGTGFQDIASKNVATIYNQSCTVVKAAPSEIQVKVPERLAPHSYTVDVTVNGVKSNTLKFDVLGAPEIGSCDLAGFVPGSEVEISGQNFTPDSSKMQVTLDVQGVKKNASVVGSTKNSVKIIVPQFPEFEQKIQGGVATPGQLTISVAGVQAPGFLQIYISIRPMVR